MVDIQEIPRISRRGALAYEKWSAIKKERSLLEARAKELKKAQDAIESEIAENFSDDLHERRLVGNKILQYTHHVFPDRIVTPEMVGTVIAKGYSYNTYKEIEG